MSVNSTEERAWAVLLLFPLLLLLLLLLPVALTSPDCRLLILGLRTASFGGGTGGVGSALSFFVVSSLALVLAPAPPLRRGVVVFGGGLGGDKPLEPVSDGEKSFLNFLDLEVSKV